jgi:hypothetical protein
LFYKKRTDEKKDEKITPSKSSAVKRTTPKSESVVSPEVPLKTVLKASSEFKFPKSVEKDA